MGNLFFLNCQKYMFSTYINDSTLLITCPDRTKVELLNLTLTNHKERTNKWLNKGIKYTIQATNKDILDITENDVTDESIKEFELTYVSINDSQDINFLNQLYELSNTQLFMMYDYDYDPSIPLLSIQGIQIIKPTSERVFEAHEYLNAVMEIDNEKRNELNNVNDELDKISSELDEVNEELDRVTEEIKNMVDEIIYLEEDLKEIKNEDTEEIKNEDTEDDDEKTDPENN